MLWNFYGSPGFYGPGVRYVFWDRFRRPAQLGTYRSGYPETWWFDPAKSTRIDEAVARLAAD